MKLTVSPRGSIVIAGSDSNFQSFVLRDIAMQTILANGSVITLVDMDSEGIAFKNSIHDYLHVTKGLPSLAANTHVLSNYRAAATAYELKRLIEEDPRRLLHRPICVVRDFARQTAHIQPEHIWLRLAAELADLTGWQVVTALSYGTDTMPKPDPKKFRGTEVWVANAALNLRLTVTKYKPENEEEPIELKGQTLSGNVLDFRKPEEWADHVAA